MLGQGVQTVRPYCRVDHPIAQAFGVVAAQMEPAVVEYEAFHADFGGAVGELVQCGFVVVEVHGFPCVEGERVRFGYRVHAPGRAAQPGVEA